MKKLTIEEVREIVKEYGLVLITDIYENNNQKLTAIDKDGYKICFKLKHLKSGHKPNPFHVSNPYTIENIQHYLKISNRNEKVRLNSKEYKNANSKLNFTCLIDGHTWDVTWGSFYSENTGCPICAINKRKGEGNGSWKGGYTPIIKCCRKAINKWKIDSFIHNNRTCDITGSKTNIVIHHLIGFNTILQEAINNLNLTLRENMSDYSQQEIVLLQEELVSLHYKYGFGVCLTRDIHEEFHSIYGKGNNTPEQYIEFKNNKLKEMEDNIIG